VVAGVFGASRVLCSAALFSGVAGVGLACLTLFRDDDDDDDDGAVERASSFLPSYLPTYVKNPTQVAL
jgi:hypothetical protein